MPKLVKKLKTNFTVINNKIFQDKNLKGIDRGILGTMLSLADNWDFSIKGLAKILPDGETAIANSLKRIEEAGYLVRKRIYKDGKISDWAYIISDEPMEKEEENAEESEKSGGAYQHYGYLDDEKLDVENQDVVKQDVENRHDNKISNNKIKNNKIPSNKESINQSANRKTENAKSQSTKSDDRLIDEYMQEQKKYMQAVKQNIDYEDFVAWIENFGSEYMTVEELDEIVGIIVRAICSRKPTETICGQALPREEVKESMLKVDQTCIQKALEAMKQTDNIRNYEKFLISTLFNEANGRHFKENSEYRQAEYAVKRDLGEVKEAKPIWTNGKEERKLFSMTQQG